MTISPDAPTPTADVLERGAGAALWKQIADRLQTEIEADGFRAADGRLPTERELTDRFRVNRHTVRRALASLAESGLVRTEQGRGVFVNADVVEYPLGRRVRFTEALTAQRAGPAGRILETAAEQASRDVAAALELKSGAPIWRVERQGFADDRPITIASHYFSRKAFPQIGKAFETEASISRVLATLGVPNYERRETRILARPATAEEARLLSLPRGRPVLVTEAINVDPNGRPIEYGVARFAADRVQLLA